ncbi:preprotein translocase subunit SecD [Isoptericola sp. CG 20/1183]|uniref:Protein translocase subunit SecD n=1 Tax=Isoptericola halotolerans TaxID=300560 RepID=A0ABX5EEZ1_9MICO|nr:MULTISPECIES: protein translocase subunit SecD [Isoptericola]PRZ04381.1 preprotein translocase subunit SecD [Isoptericola halotolerans]PRZ04721.1 preprotein translocase subunit SecD [Isoptericola sp. CG 20/1183]
MANSSTQRSRPVRTLVVFAILSMVVPFAALLAGVYLEPKTDENPGGASLAPGLALDLQGGTQIILTPVSTDGSEITDESINESINVIRQRIDSSGVAEAEIANQGGENIVVGIPGEVDQATIDLVSQPAQMRFRPVLTYEMGLPAEEAPADESAEEGSEEEATEDSGDVDARIAEEAAEVEPTDPSDLAQITPAVQEKFDALDCTDPNNLVGGGGDDPDLVLVTCANDGSMLKYILGPMEVDGTHVTTASSGLVPGPNGSVTNEWGVFIEMDAEGTEQFRETTERLQGLEPPRNQFGIVLDGLVISAPSLDPGVIISDGRPQISGNFTRDSAATLANQLSFGSLPINYEVQSQETISATLGSEQLRNGLLAGLVGMALVVVYSLFQYRTLGLVTVGSLLVAGVITYLSIALLSWGMGYRLSLAGVAGLIVAIGFTADSFIVYFERIRDEVRDGRSMPMAVERGWRRAKRTVLAAKSVTLISAIVLYFLAVGGVQGFAFTLGLTTIIDIAVVFWFTHPMLQLLTKVPFFRDGHAWSGLSPERLRATGPRYVGAGKVSTPAPAGAPAADEPAPEPALAGARAGVAPTTDASGRRLTIAERRAAERRAAAGPGDGPPDDAPGSPRTDDAGSGENEENR